MNTAESSATNDKKQWTRRPIRNLHVTVREPDIIDLDVKRFVETLVDLRCNFVTLLTGGYHCLYQSTIPLNRVNPNLGTRDLLGELVEGVHKHGIKIGACIDVAAAPRPVYEHHPEWFVRDSNGQPFLLISHPVELFAACPIAGYLEGFIHPVVEEHLRLYDFDHFNLTGFSFGPYGSGICHCHTCQTRFRRASSRELPRGKSDPVWKQYMRWRTEELHGEYRSSIDRILKVKPQIATWINQAYDITATPYANLEFLSEHQDLIKTEAQTKIYFDNIDEGIDLPPLTFPGEEGRYFSNLSDKQVITTTSYYFAWPWRKTAVPEAMQRIWIAEAVANNVAPFVHISGFPQNQEDRRGLKPLREIFHFLAENETYFANVESYVNVALCLSRASQVLYDGERLRQNYSQHFRGAYAALAESHVPFDIISEQHFNLERLSKYRVLVLPNFAAMSDTETATLEQYVREGGCLIATYETSLFDEEGKRRDDYALSQVFGCRITGRKIGPLAGTAPDGKRIMSYMHIRDNHPLLQGIGDTDIVLNGGFLWITAPLEGAEVPLTAQLPYRIFPEGEAWTSTGKTDIPAAIASRHGKGKVVFFPGMIDRLYGLFGFPDHRLLFGNAVRWMLGEESLIQVKAPVTVDVMMQTQAATGRIMVHLINLTGKRPHSEFIPIRDIEVEVRLKSERPPSRVLLASTAEEIPFKTKNGTVTATINELEIYDIIVLEPKDS